MTEVTYEEPSITTPESRVSIDEVLRRVVPEGACKGLGQVEARQGVLREVVSLKGENDEERQLLQDMEERVKELQPVLGQFFKNEIFLSTIAKKSEGEEISPEGIREHIETEESDISKRLSFILNHNIDPELIPLIYYTWHVRDYSRTRTSLPVQGLILDTLRRSEDLRYELTRLLIDEEFMGEYRDVIPKDGKTFSERYLSQVEGFIQKFLEEAKRSPLRGKPEERLEKGAKMYFENYFFNLLRVGRLLEEDSLGLFSYNTRRVIADVYFQFPDYPGWPISPGWSFNKKSSFQPEIRGYLIKHAKALEIGKYLAGLYRKVGYIYWHFFPQIYFSSEGVKLKMEIKKPYRTEKEKPLKEQPVEEGVGGGYIERELTIETGTEPKVGSEGVLNERTLFYKDRDIKAQRSVVDSIIMSHELAHYVYERLVFKRAEEYQEGYYETVDHAVNEGFAVLVELLFIDVLRSNPGLLNLNKEDLRNIEQYKWARLYRLKRELDAYAEGTYRILHKVYERGAGSIKNREIAKGLIAVRQFLESVNPEKTRGTLRTDPEYKRLLKESDPEKWRRFLSGKN